MHARAAIAILAAALGWGLAGVGSRALFIDGVSTFTVISFRVAIATAAVVGYVRITRTSISRAAWREGALIGIPRIGLAPTFFIASLNYVSAGFEALIITIIPVTTAVMAHFWIDESVTKRQLAGMALGLAGTALLILSGDSGIAGDAGNTLIGGGLALAGVLAGSASGVLSRKYAPDHETAALAAPMFLVGTLFVFVVGAAFRDIVPAEVSATNWLVLVGLGLGSTLLPFTATLYASRIATATQVSLTGYLAPLIGVIGGAVLLDEVITAAIAVGGALTLAGVVVASRSAERAPDLVE